MGWRGVQCCDSLNDHDHRAVDPPVIRRYDLGLATFDVNLCEMERAPPGMPSEHVVQPNAIDRDLFVLIDQVSHARVHIRRECRHRQVRVSQPEPPRLLTETYDRPNVDITGSLLREQ